MIIVAKTIYMRLAPASPFAARAPTHSQPSPRISVAASPSRQDRCAHNSGRSPGRTPRLRTRRADALRIGIRVAKITPDDQEAAPMPKKPDTAPDARPSQSTAARSRPTGARSARRFRVGATASARNDQHQQRKENDQTLTIDHLAERRACESANSARNRKGDAAAPLHRTGARMIDDANDRVAATATALVPIAICGWETRRHKATAAQRESSRRRHKTSNSRSAA